MSASLWNELLPTSVVVCDTAYEIRSDYRAALDICAALSDAGLEEQEKAFVILDIFYPTLSDMPQEHYQRALEQCFWFISCGSEESARPGPRLMDWERDFKLIIAPVNRVLGTEARAADYLHWWTFVSAYNEIGECLFSQVVRIRNQLYRGKRLDKADAEWYRNNRHMVDLDNKYTAQDHTILKQWGGG